ncbi:MAG: hypothetical protein AAGU05_07380, partial [Anaerolineaceae bacterium]
TASPAPATATAAPTAEILPTPTIAPTEEPVIPCTIAFETNRDGNLEIYAMAPDGSNPANLTNDPADDFKPAWSPDGSRIAFVSNRDLTGEGGQHIFVINADGTDLKQITLDFYADDPSWSPDGAMLTYEAGGDIFIVNADGEPQPVNLTNSTTRDARPVWS